MNVLVVPAFIRSDWDACGLKRLLKSVDRDDDVHRVVVVDDASPCRFTAHGTRAEVVRLDANGGPARARNVGIERALSLGATNVMFTDHDCVLEPGWARSLASFLAAAPYDAAGGRTFALGSTLLDRFHDVNGTLNGRWVLPERQELLYAPTCNFAVTSKVARLYRFDERFPGAAGEDVEFCFRVRRQFRIGLCPDAVVRHDYGYPSTCTGLRRFVAMFKKYKAANAIVWGEHRGLDWTASEAIPSEVS